MRLPGGCSTYRSARELFTQIRDLFPHYLGLPESDSGLVACFVIRLPLRHSQVDGVIIAMGSLSAPSSIPERTNVPVELVLWDEWENEFCFNFEAQLSRTLKVVRERREQANRPACHGREPLFKREDGQVGNQVYVSLEEAIEEAIEQAHASHEQDATGDSRTPTTK